MKFKRNGMPAEPQEGARPPGIQLGGGALERIKTVLLKPKSGIASARCCGPLAD